MRGIYWRIQKICDLPNDKSTHRTITHRVMVHGRAYCYISGLLILICNNSVLDEFKSLKM